MPFVANQEWPGADEIGQVMKGNRGKKGQNQVPERYVIQGMCRFSRLKRLPSCILTFGIALFSVSGLSAQDWSDVEEPELIGSAREGRVTDFLLGSYEDWTNERGEKRRSLSLLFIFHATWYPKYHSWTVFPLYHRRTSRMDERRETILFPLFWRQYTDAEDDFLLSPLGYYRRIDGRTTTVLGPYLAWHKSYETNNRQTYQGYGILPLFHLGTDYEPDYEGYRVKERSLFVFPLLSYFEWNEQSSLHMFPVLPFLYYRHAYADSKIQHQTTFIIPFFSSSESTEDRSSWEFNILPLWYSSGHSSENGSEALFAHLLPLFYYDAEENVDKRYRTIFFPSIPFLFYNKSFESKNRSSVTRFFLTAYYSRYRKATGSTPEQGLSHALLPLYLYSSENDQSTLWIFPAFFAKRGKEGEASSTTLFPFYSRSYTPATEQTPEETAFWLLPYYSWKNSNSQGRHVLPLYWQRHTAETDTMMVTPLYWKWRRGDSHKQIAPFLYTSRWKEDVVLTDEEHRGLKERRQYHTTYILNYYSWNHPDSEGYLFFPLRYRSSDRMEEYDLYIPVTFSTLHSLATAENGGLYLDSDYSVGYNVFSLSTRIPILDRSIPVDFNRTEGVQVFDPDEMGNETETTETAEGPTITRGKDIDPFDRTNTNTYMGWQALFGWTSYIRADTRRHFRIIPLTWLSWNEADENERLTFIFAFYLNYRTEEEQYTAVFPAFLPVYGSYTRGKSYARVYGGPLYITSYDEESEESQQSILWPFFKSYSSPEASGHRLIPVYSARTEKTENGEYYRTFSWLHYGSRTTSVTDEETTTTSFFISPLYFRNASRIETDSKTTERVFQVYPIPLLSHFEDNEREKYNLLLLFETEASKDGSYQKRYAFPLYYHSRETTEAGHITDFWLTPLYIGSKTKDGQKTLRVFHIFPIPMLTYGSSEKRSGFSLLILLGSHSTKDGSYSENFLLPLFYRYRKSTAEGEITNTWIANLFHSYYNPKTKTTEKDILWPFFGYYNSPDESGWHFFPLVAHKTTTKPDLQKVKNFSLLHSYKSVSATGQQPGESFSLTILLFYQRRYAATTSYTDDDHWLIWPLLRRHRAAEHDRDGCTRTETDYRLYPIIYYTTHDKRGSCTTSTESSFLLFPVIYTERQPHSQKDFLFGYYRHSRKDYGFHNFLYLVDYTYYTDYRELGLAFHAIEYRRNSQGSRFQLLWGLAAEWNHYRPTTGEHAREAGYDFRFLTYFQRNNSHRYGNDFETALLPLYSYYTNEEQTRYWILPTLSFHESKKGYLYEQHLLYLWYQTKDDMRNTEQNWLLWGILYSQERKNQRGFQTRGSLWGYLWSYTTEDETGYENFSLLGGLLYSKVVHPADNRQYARFLLIPLYDEPIH